MLQLLRRHLFRLINNRRAVVLIPITGQQAAGLLEIPPELRAGIRRQDMKCRTLQTIRFDPIDGPSEHVRSVVVESQHKAAIHLNAVTMKNLDAASIVFGRR